MYLTCFSRALTGAAKLIPEFVPKPFSIIQQVRCMSYLKADRIRRAKSRLPWYPKPSYQSEVLPATELEEQQIADLTTELNTQIANESHGRLFAVIHVMGKQYKITESDLIVLPGYWPPNIGDKVIFEKVLLVGGTDFTLVGRPMLHKDLVTVEATVVNKTLSNTIYHYIFRKKKRSKTLNFYRYQLTMVRINKILLHGKLDEKKEIEGELNLYD